MKKEKKDHRLKIQILVDNPKSWIRPYAKDLAIDLRRAGHTAQFIDKHSALKKGDILCLLGCEKILSQSQLSLHRHNLVVHESALPQGRGWSPLTWQVLEGKNKIFVSLIDATEQVDRGALCGQTTINLSGYELVDELRRKQAKASASLIKQFIAHYPKVKKIPQKGSSSFYRRRKPEDSRLDIHRPIRDQFNLLRVVDNERYPAFFELNGHKYILKIEKVNHHD